MVVLELYSWLKFLCQNCPSKAFLPECALTNICFTQECRGILVNVHKHLLWWTGTAFKIMTAWWQFPTSPNKLLLRLLSTWSVLDDTVYGFVEIFGMSCCHYPMSYRNVFCCSRQEVIVFLSVECPRWHLRFRVLVVQICKYKYLR